jgi:catalase
MSAEQQKALFENTARSIDEANKQVKLRHISNCYKADPAYGEGVAKSIGIDLSEVTKK